MLRHIIRLASSSFRSKISRCCASLPLCYQLSAAPMKISKYIVISEPNLAKFQHEVQLAIDQNWQPHGSLQVTNENHMIWYSQSMVQYITAAVQKKATTTLSSSQPVQHKIQPTPAAHPVSAPVVPEPAPVSAPPPAVVPDAAPLAELPPPAPPRPPVRGKPLSPHPSLAPFPSLATTEPTSSKPLVSTPSSPPSVRAKISPRLRPEPGKAVTEIPPLSTARPFPASSNFSPQFLWARNKRYTIFDAVELPGGIAQLSCTVAEGDFERLTLSVGKEAELDEKGRITAKIRIRSVSRRGASALIEVSL